MPYIGRAPTESMLDKTDVAAKKVALRDLPANTADPETPSWPEKPE